jgi:hypothetical protein
MASSLRCDGRCFDSVHELHAVFVSTADRLKSYVIRTSGRRSFGALPKTRIHR